MANITLTTNAIFGTKGNDPGQSFFTLTGGAATVYATGGFVADISKVIPPNARFADLIAVSGVSSLGHSVLYVPGATALLAKFKLFNGTTEVANATSLTGLVLTFTASFGPCFNTFPVTALTVG